MKKTKLLFLFLLIFTSSNAQKAVDFYAGKWEIEIVGTQRGNIKYVTNLVRIEGKLTGELIGEDEDKRKITKVEEKDNKINISYESPQSGSDVTLEFTKVDENNLKGTIMGHDVTAKRIID